MLSLCVVLLSGFMLLVSCGPNIKTIRVVAAQYTDKMQPYFDDLSARFSKENPDIKVAVEVVSWNDIDQKIKTMVQTKDYPDIGNLNYFSSFAADGLLYKADEIVSPEVLADILPTFLNNSMYNGVPYAVPDLASARLFFYNKDIFDKAGVTADDIKTWDGVKAAAAKIKAKVKDVTPIHIPLGKEEAQAEFMIWSNSNDGGVYSNDQWTISSDKNVATLDFLNGLVNSGLANADAATSERTSGAFALFGQGKVAMLNGAIFLPSILKEKGSTVNYGVTNFPTNRADGKSITLGVQDYFFGFKKEGNQKAVQKYLSFLFKADNYAAFLVAAGGFLPATVSAAANVTPEQKPYVDVLPNAVFYPSSQAAWSAVQGEIQQTIGTAMNKGADYKAILTAIEAKTK